MIRIEPYDAAWADRFAELGRGLRDALGDVALRIDHIGSTAVPGLAAKPIIDIQISVAALEPSIRSAVRRRRVDTYTAPTTPNVPSAKLPWFWQTIRQADTWSHSTGWEPAPSDA